MTTTPKKRDLLMRWLGGVISAALDVVGGVVKGVQGFVAGAIAGIIRMGRGALARDGARVLEGLWDVGSSLSGGVLLILGKLVGLIQTILPIEHGRALTAAEVALLKWIFRQSVAFDSVRLVEGWTLFSVTDRPFTLGNTIYLKDRDVSAEPGLLVHECTHVWQYEHEGARYISDALTAQWFEDDAYRWENEITHGHARWTGFNKEAQAQFLQDIYTNGELVSGETVSGPGGGVFYDADGARTFGRFVYRGVDHTERANDAVSVVRGAGADRLVSLGRIYLRD